MSEGENKDENVGEMEGEVRAESGEAAAVDTTKENANTQQTDR